METILNPMKTFLIISIHRMMDHYLPKLNHVLQAISTEELWKHEAPHLNSIGGIVLHICEHLDRSKLRFASGITSYSKGIEEYFPDRNLTRDELLLEVDRQFKEWHSTMASYMVRHVTEEEDLPLGFDDMHHLYHLVEHSGYHLGQIVDRIKRITGQSFLFCQNGISEKSLKDQILNNLE
jgi:hypothetical protein